MRIGEFQELIKELYLEKDKKRGIEGTFIWLVEEIGELARSLKEKEKKRIDEEIADVFAWLVSLANLTDVDVEMAVMKKYPGKCKKCGEKPCRCEEL